MPGGLLTTVGVVLAALDGAELAPGEVPVPVGVGVVGDETVKIVTDVDCPEVMMVLIADGAGDAAGVEDGAGVAVDGNPVSLVACVCVSGDGGLYGIV